MKRGKNEDKKFVASIMIVVAEWDLKIQVDYQTKIVCLKKMYYFKSDKHQDLIKLIMLISLVNASTVKNRDATVSSKIYGSTFSNYIYNFQCKMQSFNVLYVYLDPT